MMKKMITAGALALTLTPLVIAAPAQAASKTYKLSGILWNDVNKNGRIDAKEMRSPNFNLQIKNYAGKVVKTVKTDKAGYYVAYLPKGTYTVSVPLQKGYAINKSTKLYLNKTSTMYLPIVKVAAPAPKPAPKPVTPKGGTPNPIPVTPAPTSDALTKQLVDYVNAHRKAKGLAPVSLSTCLSGYAKSEVDSWKKAGQVNTQSVNKTNAEKNCGYGWVAGYYSKSTFGRSIGDIYNDLEKDYYLDPYLKGIGARFDGEYIKIYHGWIYNF